MKSVPSKEDSGSHEIDEESTWLRNMICIKFCWKVTNEEDRECPIRC